MKQVDGASMSEVKPSKGSENSPNLATNVKRLRKDKNLNMSQLAKNSGLPQSTLSKVENGQMSLNYDKLLILARALNVDIQELFQSGSDLNTQKLIMARRCIDKANEGTKIKSEHYIATYLSKDIKNRLMIPVLIEVTPDNDEENPISMDIIGERFAYVVDGPVNFHCDHYETLLLEEGDSIYVDAAMPHGFTSINGKGAKIITVLSSEHKEYMEKARQATLKGIADVSNTIPH